MAESRAERRLWSPLVVAGLTGGIKSGKSTVSRMFADLGAVVLNADDEGRSVVEPGEPALAELVAAFGPEYLLPDGRLNRSKVAERVFGHQKELDILNRITHPRIDARLREKLAALARRPPKPPVIVIEAAILVEAGWNRLVDRVVVLNVQPSTQVGRLMAGFGLTVCQAEARLRSQMPAERRLRYGDYIINGELSLSATQQQVEAAWQDLCRLAPPSFS